jgi:hypothetical protein
MGRLSRTPGAGVGGRAGDVPRRAAALSPVGSCRPGPARLKTPAERRGGKPGGHVSDGALPETALRFPDCEGDREAALERGEGNQALAQGQAAPAAVGADRAVFPEWAWRPRLPLPFEGVPHRADPVDGRAGRPKRSRMFRSTRRGRPTRPQVLCAQAIWETSVQARRGGVEGAFLCRLSPTVSGARFL